MKQSEQREAVASLWARCVSVVGLAAFGYSACVLGFHPINFEWILFALVTVLMVSRIDIGFGTATAPGRSAPSAPRRSSAAQQARAAASRAGATQRGGGSARRPAESAWEGSQDEPPYDPDYDGPVADPQYPGFDPGDEPLDDADPAAVRESTEEAALRLLSEALGAEKINDVGP